MKLNYFSSLFIAVYFIKASVVPTSTPLVIQHRRFKNVGPASCTIFVNFRANFMKFFHFHEDLAESSNGHLFAKKRWKENNPKTPPKIIKPGLPFCF
jgi:hypothetical protein